MVVVGASAPQKAGPESSTLSSTPHRVVRCRGECSQRRHPLSLARLQCVVRSSPTVAGLRGVIPHICAAFDGPSRHRVGACHVLRGEGDLCAFLVPLAAAVSPFVPRQAAPPGPGTTRVWGVAVLRPMRAWFRTAQVQVQGKAWTACRRRANLRPPPGALGPVLVQRWRRVWLPASVLLARCGWWRAWWLAVSHGRGFSVVKVPRPSPPSPGATGLRSQSCGDKRKTRPW